MCCLSCCASSLCDLHVYYQVWTQDCMFIIRSGLHVVKACPRDRSSFTNLHQKRTSCKSTEVGVTKAFKCILSEYKRPCWHLFSRGYIACIHHALGAWKGATLVLLEQTATLGCTCLLSHFFRRWLAGVARCEGKGRRAKVIGLQVDRSARAALQ